MHEVLDDYHLSDSRRLVERVSSLDDETIRSITMEIERFYDSKLNSTLSEFRSRSSINIIQYPNLEYLEFSKRLCLYADRIALNDPILGILNLTGLGFNLDFIKQQLQQELESYLALRKLVENKIAYFIPFQKILSRFASDLSNMTNSDCETELPRNLYGQYVG